MNPQLRQHAIVLKRYRVVNVSDPVYAPNSKGGPQADSARYQPASWHSDGDMVRSAYTLHEQDDDWGQPGTMVREALDDAARQRLADNIVGHLLNGVSEPVLQRAFQYWRNVDKNLGDRIETGVAPSRARRTRRPPRRQTPPALACRTRHKPRSYKPCTPCPRRRRRACSPAPVPVSTAPPVPARCAASVSTTLVRSTRTAVSHGDRIRQLHQPSSHGGRPTHGPRTASVGADSAVQATRSAHCHPPHRRRGTGWSWSSTYPRSRVIRGLQRT
jgi:Catalase-related immune-responsive